MLSDYKTFDHKTVIVLRKKLINWYIHHGRRLPWRIHPKDLKQKPDPYKIWLSEVMLQQTQVHTVISYFEKFIKNWSTLESLANARLDEVLTAWAGLGYYARARNLYACAHQILTIFKGKFPDSEKQLLTLPGIGPYTAAALTAICFQKSANVVDGNVERVISRLFACLISFPKGKPVLKEMAKQISDPENPGDYAQALMDLGALICRPRNPDCPICPWQSKCRAYTLSNLTPELLPIKKTKPKKPKRYGISFVCFNLSDLTNQTCKNKTFKLLLRKRPLKGLLAGMVEFPGTIWQNTKWEKNELKPFLIKELKNIHFFSFYPEKKIQSSNQQTFSLNWYKLPKPVQHAFTHFYLSLDVWVCIISDIKIQHKSALFPKESIHVTQKEWTQLVANTRKNQPQAIFESDIFKKSDQTGMLIDNHQKITHQTIPSNIPLLFWHPEPSLSDLALPKIMQKVYQQANGFKTSIFESHTDSIET